MSLNCTFIDGDSVECNGTRYFLPEERLTYRDTGFWVYLAVYVGLVLLAGLMSGLTMGLLSLDMMTLRVMKDGGTPREKRHAEKILPIVRRHHLLLVTLLLGNAVAVEAMPIFLDRVSDPITAIVVSVSAVLIFGEVIPQAICTRFGLAIGATLAPFVYVLMALTFVVAWPLSKLLDCLLGRDHSTFYRRAELKVLVDLHGSSGGDNDENLSYDEVMIIKGALDMKNKSVKDAMVPIDCVYMLDINDIMDYTTMTQVLDASHSRIPVYDGGRENIVGLLLVKTLIKLDPEDATPITSLVDTAMFQPILHTTTDQPLFDILNTFQEGKGHLAVVTMYRDHEVSAASNDDVFHEDPDVPLLQNEPDDDDNMLDIRPSVVGIITLEDVIEELIQEEIIDETDVYVDIKRHIHVARARAARRDRPPTRACGYRRSQSHPPVSRRLYNLPSTGTPVHLPDTVGVSGAGNTKNIQSHTDVHT